MKRILTSILTAALLLPHPALVSHAALTQAVDNLAGASEVVTHAPRGKDASFRDADFGQALGVVAYPDLTILSLPDPTEGVLKFHDLRVSAGQVIPRAAIAHLKLSPTSDMTEEAHFTFRAGNLCGGAALTCTVRFTDKKNEAPTVAGASTSCSFTTRKNASLWGTLTCYDPEGDELTYLVVSYPRRGTLQVTDRATGAFRYTPEKGFHGKDSFTYVVRDSYGNYSSVATVQLTVDKHERDFSITDMEESAASDAALRMVRADIMTVETSGYAVYFHPKGTMTRAEFLVAAMKAGGKLQSASDAWAYDDLAAIPASARPYVTAATEAGYTCPVWDGGLYFHPQEPVTGRDAVAWVTRICGTCPTGIDKTLGQSDEPLTRAEAAVILLAVSGA